MQQLRDIRFDVASGISQGRRPYQEDALVTDFPLGADVGFAVLADGMGGHAAGDIASKIVVTEVFSELKLQSGNLRDFRKRIPKILANAAQAANDCVKVHVDNHIETSGMGATLLAPVFDGTRLFWVSVGDSPLFLYRDGRLRQLNEDHSMAPQIDFMIRSGMIPEEVGRNHPDRSALTSVLGGDPIARIDCPSEPLDLVPGDILIAASDGILYLSEEEIESILLEHRDYPSSVIADVILARLEDQADPEQDNASFSIIKVELSRQRSKRLLRHKRPAQAEPEAEEAAAAAAPPPPSRFKASIFLRGGSLFRGSAQ